MKNKEKLYCQLEHYNFCKLTPRNPFTIQQVFFTDSQAHFAYVEKYQDVESVKSRILELNQEWKKGEIYRKNNNIYLMIYLANRWEDYIYIGIRDPIGWFILGISEFTLEFINNTQYGEQTNEEPSVFEFYIPCYMECLSTEIISDKLAWQTIKEWLNTGSYTQYFLNESEEIETRQYIYQTNTKIVKKEDVLF